MNDQETPNAPHVGPDAAYLITEKRAKWTPAEIAADVEQRRSIQVTIIDVNAREKAREEGVPYMLDRASIDALWSGPACPVKQSVYTYGRTSYLTNPTLVCAIPVLGYVPGNVFICSVDAARQRYDDVNPDIRVGEWFRSIWAEATKRFGDGKGLRGLAGWPQKPKVKPTK